MIKIRIFEGATISDEVIKELNKVFEKWKTNGFQPKRHECYKNARRLTIDSNNFFKYCEGCVVPNIQSHAWNIYEESIIDVSIAPDGKYYTITGIPRNLTQTPLVDYIYSGTEISFESVTSKEKEVGHISGGSFQANGSEKFGILKQPDLETAKKLVMSKWKNNFNK